MTTPWLWCQHKVLYCLKIVILFTVCQDPRWPAQDKNNSGIFMRGKTMQMLVNCAVILEKKLELTHTLHCESPPHWNSIDERKRPSVHWTACTLRPNACFWIFRTNGGSSQEGTGNHDFFSASTTWSRSQQTIGQCSSASDTVSLYLLQTPCINFRWSERDTVVHTGGKCMGKINK